MNTRKIIEGIRERMHDPSYVSALKNEYAAQVKDGTFYTEEHEYDLAVEYLKCLPEDKKAQLAEMEKLYSGKYDYASTYPFYCGLLCAFEQYFNPNQQQAFDYSTIIGEKMCTMPHMQRHRSFYEKNTAILELTEKLLDDADEVTTDHITSINCGWDQRIHSATIYSFYIGYRFGLEILDEVIPMSAATLMPKTLFLEYELGFTAPYSFRERQNGPTESEVSA